MNIIMAKLLLIKEIEMWREDNKTHMQHQTLKLEESIYNES